jgi:capsular polysaccharide transport system permease protein
MADEDITISAARLHRVEPHKSAPPPEKLDWQAYRDRAQAFARAHPWFMAVVVIPSVLALLFYGVIASDLYVSEARYIVRSVNGPRPGPFATMLQNTGLAAAQDDAYTVRDFVLSRDITRRLEREHDLKGVLSRPEGDFFTSFPAPFAGHSFEQLYRSYGRFVSVSVDDTSGISTLRVRAFRPDDARNTANAILSYSEELINRLNDRARHDAIDVAEREVARSEVRVAAAQAALMDYRVENRTLDPEHASGAVLELATKLSAESAAAQAQLSEVLKASPGSPLIPALRRRIAALNSQVAAERNKVVGPDRGAVRTLSKYERLMLEREFADKSLASAVTSLQTARIEAQRKQVYLDRIVEPNLPDYPLFPRRLISILEVMLSTLLIYGIGWLVSASVREHVGR